MQLQRMSDYGPTIYRRFRLSDKFCSCVESVVIISYFSEVVARPLLQNMGTNTGYFGLNLMLLFVINY